MSAAQETSSVQGLRDAAEGGGVARQGVLHIPSLDGIRAISFGLVFVGHAGLNFIIPAAFGVTIFFFLSGYLITSLLRLEWQKTHAISLKKFYLRRALRILPPFYLVFLIAYVAYEIGLSPPPIEPVSMRSVLLHYSNYYMVDHDNQGFLLGTGVYWSLAVEEHFYVVFPFVFLLIARTGVSAKKQALILLGLCALTLAWRCLIVFTTNANMLRTHVASDTRFDSLLFGCILALYENPALDRSSFSERAWKAVFFPLGLGGLLVCFAIRNEHFRESLRYTLQGLSLIPIFVCAIRYPAWLPMRFLNLRPIAFIGVLSYSLYLLHLFVLGVLSRHLEAALGPVTIGVLGLALSLLSSWIMYITVEKPCGRIRKRLTA